MEQILESLTLYMMIGIVLVIGISQFNRILGGILGVAFWVTVGIVGSYGYDHGWKIGLPGFEFPRPLFIAMCLTFSILCAFTAYSAYAKRTRITKRPQPAEEVDDDDAEP